MTSLVAVFALVVSGLPLAWALTRAVPLATLLAPLAGAAVATVGVLLSLWLGGPLLPWFGAAFLGSIAVAWSVRRAAPLPGGSWREAGWLGVPLLPLFLLVFKDPLGWDAHAIWWLHAGYFAHGGGFARAAIGNEALVLNHTDYPPLSSAPVAVAWQLLDSYTFRPALSVNVAVTFSAVVLVAYAVRRATAGLPRWLSIPVALLAACGAWLPDFRAPTEGYSDTLCASAFVAGAVLLLGTSQGVQGAKSPLPGAGAKRLRNPLLPLSLFLVAAAILTKNEGLPLALILAVVATVRFRSRAAAWCWLPLAAGVAWSSTARAFGARNDLMSGGRFGALLRGDAERWGRLPPVQDAMLGQVRFVVGAALVTALLGAVFLRGRRRALGLGGDGWLWAVLGGYWVAITLIYLISPYPIIWHLATSVDRVTIVLAMLATVSASIWLAVALAPKPSPADQVSPDEACVA
ncbi:hypothetical protein [Dactylosporangium sp. NPDC051541]|uniref:hypothetical protein n=1 Tax=Dactylosporangium sp. NPDC051541 TaxID=3363977 RepID=UPI0037B64DAC